MEGGRRRVFFFQRCKVSSKKGKKPYRPFRLRNSLSLSFSLAFRIFYFLTSSLRLNK